MLENRDLFIQPWFDTAAGRVRCILDAHDAVLGQVHWLPRRWPASMWHGILFVVREVQDASLLMTVRRPWGPLRMWQVRDAEERFIGNFLHGYLFDGMGYLLAAQHVLSDAAEDETPTCGRFVTRAGVELGRWETRSTSYTLSFCDVPESSPFARMMLLGKVLSLDLPQA